MKNSVEKYCGGCEKVIVKNGGIAPYGTVEDRLKCEDIMEFKDPSGKQTVSFVSVMKKLKIEKEEVLKEAEKLGWEVPECHFEMKASKKGRKGRPKKESSASADTEDSESDAGSAGSAGSEETEKKQRGRPKKENSIELVNVGEDLIASLILDSKVGTAEMEDRWEAETSESIMDLELGVEEVEEEDETTVEKKEINGITYLISDENVLYDLNSHDCVGIWDEETQTINEMPDEEEEEEEE